jgi:hypothetical protein
MVHSSSPDKLGDEPFVESHEAKPIRLELKVDLTRRSRRLRAVGDERLEAAVRLARVVSFDDARHTSMMTPVRESVTWKQSAL